MGDLRGEVIRDKAYAVVSKDITCFRQKVIFAVQAIIHSFRGKDVFLKVF